MNRRLLLLVIVVILAVSAFAVRAGGGDERPPAPTTYCRAAPGRPPAPSGEPIKFGFDEGFTSFMAYDCELADQGVKTALAMLNNQWEGRPLEYYPEDNASDPVDRRRQGPEARRAATRSMS